jgi:uncharacterized Fe-S cluster protein YjdI/CDGSH-type Zn-finger protein
MPRRLQIYSTDVLTVTYAPERCTHVAACVRALPQVFAPKERPWIRMELADAESIAAAVEQCPTGALQLKWTDGRAVAPASEPAAITIRVQRMGALVVTGPMRIESESDGELIAEDTRVSLCRCGHTRNSPFCDGTHRTLRFDDQSSTGGAA